MHQANQKRPQQKVSMFSDSYKATLSHFRNQFFASEELINLWHGKLQPLPFHRRRTVSDWQPQQQSRFIESLIVGQPQPALFFDGSQTEWYIVDGRKRLTALSDFVQGRFALQSLYFLGDMYENQHFDQLPLLVRRKILNFKFEVNLLNPNTPDLVRYGVYTGLLAKGNSDVSNPCRDFLFPEGFKTLKRLYRETNPRRSGLLRSGFDVYSPEGVTGRLLVFHLYRLNMLRSNYEVLRTPVEVLVNELLTQPDLESLVQESRFAETARRIFEQIDRPRLTTRKQAEKQEAMLALLSTQPQEQPPRNWEEWATEAWKEIPATPPYTGQLLENYLKRYLYLKQQLETK